MYSFTLNPFTGKLDAVTSDGADIHFHCADNDLYYTISIVIDPEMNLPTIAFTVFPIWRNWIDEVGNFWVDEAGNNLGETY